MTLWVLTIPSNSRSDATTFTQPIRLTNMAFTAIRGKERCNVELHLSRGAIEDPVVCHLGLLTPGKVEHYALDLVLDVGREIVFINKGESAICLSGYYLEPEMFTNTGRDEGTERLSRSNSVDSVAAMLLPAAGLSRSDSMGSVATTLQPRLKNSATLGRRNSSLSTINTTFHALEVKPVVKGRKRKAEAVSTAVAASSKAKENVTNKRKLDSITTVATPPGSAPLPTPDGPDAPAAPNDDTSAAPNDASAAAVTGIEYRDTEKGDVDGNVAIRGADVEIYFVLSVAKVDVRWRLAHTTFKFTVGDPSVIKGLNLGVLGMRPDGERHLTIPAHLAFSKKGLAEKALLYGACGAGVVPPDSPVRMKVKMHKVYLPDEH